MNMTDSDEITTLLERLSRVLQNESHAEGLKPTQWEALRYLERANRFSRTPSGLTAYLGMTKGTVSQTLNALERKDLIRKTLDKADRRQVRIDLTAKGKGLLKRDPLAAVASAVSALKTSHRSGLNSGLEALLTESLRQRGGRPFGACHTCRYHEANAPDGAPHRCSLLDVTLSADDSTLICFEHERAA